MGGLEAVDYLRRSGAFPVLSVLVPERLTAGELLLPKAVGR